MLDLGQKLNTESIANIGLTLAAACGATLASLIGNLAGPGPVPFLPLAFALGGLLVGAAMAYVGRPSTIPPKGGGPAPGEGTPSQGDHHDG